MELPVVAPRYSRDTLFHRENGAIPFLRQIANFHVSIAGAKDEEAEAKGNRSMNMLTHPAESREVIHYSLRQASNCSIFFIAF